MTRKPTPRPPVPDAVRVLRRLRRKLKLGYLGAISKGDWGADSAYADAIHMVDAELARLRTNEKNPAQPRGRAGRGSR